MAIDIKIDATARFTQALSISKDGASGSFTNFFWSADPENWSSIFFFNFSGNKPSKMTDIFWKNLTMNFENNEGWNLSFI